MPKIAIEKLSFSYGHSCPVVLSDINFSIVENETVGIIGANGVGKSTLLKLLSGLELDFSGSLSINDKSVNKKNIKQLRKDIGYVFQDSDSQLFMSRVWDDVIFGPQNHGYTLEEAEAATLMALKKVHIEHLQDQQIYKLSGGQKKLASLATILALNPDIILLDEPSAALDPINRRNLINTLNEINGIKIVASHDLDFIMDTCQRTILLHHGEIVQDGSTVDILQNKKLLEENGLELPLSLSRSSL